MENLESLKQQTKENIENRKSLDFRPPSRYRDVEDYNKKYLQKSIGERVEPVIVNIKGKEEEVKFIAAPVPDKNILLAMAFSKAEKLFDEMKIKLFGKKEFIEQKIFSTQELAGGEDGAGAVLNPIECLAMSSHLLRGKNKSLVKSLKKGEMEQLNEFANILPIVHKALKELRNYHAHILHEPGPLKFENLYGEDIPANKHTQEKWDAAKKWFIDKMGEAKAHRIKTLNKELERNDLSLQKRKDTEKVLNTIIGYEFERNGFVTPEALLFIACMFLRKGDAEYFVKKWNGLKKTDDIFRTTQTFFTYYSIRDKKSLHTQNSALLKFRKIIGILSTMPEFKNDCFLPFNNFMKNHNDSYGRKIDNEDNKRKKDDLNSYCMPLRKNFNPTHWYLNYLVERDYLNEFKIACYKTPVERLEYMGEHAIDKGVEDLKLRMKHATGDEKRQLTAIYKESKKNFLFKTPSASNENYCIKNENAIVQYSFQNPRDKDTEVTVQANFSSDLLMKWVFADIVLDKEKVVRDKIKKFLTDQYLGLYYHEYNKKGLLLPPSIDPKKAADNPQLNYSVDNAQALMLQKLKELHNFQKQNESQRAPWKFNTKKKMDLIFDYVHLSYTFKALDTNKTVDDRRHEAMSDMEYLDALDYIRFYGKNYNTDEFTKFFFEDKKEYFHSLEGCISKAETLEELYNEVFGQFCKFYEKIYKQASEKNLPKFIKLFKPSISSDKKSIENHASLFATNQVVLHELINIQELAAGMQECNEWIEYRNQNNKNRKVSFAKEFNTDFSLMRFWLCKRNPIDTNSDFMMKIMLPELFRKNLLQKNEQGKIKGNTAMFNTLMKNKTDELMMWEIAKSYREKAYSAISDIKVKGSLEKIYRSEYDLPILVKGTNTILNTPYKSSLFFFKLYSRELTLPLQDKEGNNEIAIKIKPKKFDDEFQYYETGELYQFIRNYKPKMIDGEYRFEQLNKDMKDVMAKYLDDIYLLLRVEKEIVRNNYEELAGILNKKSQTKENWDGYHFIFGRQDAKNADENVLSNMVYNAIHPSQNGFGLNDLIIYRNKILHQQIQPNKEKYISIKRALFNYCLKNNMIK